MIKNASRRSPVSGDPVRQLEKDLKRIARKEPKSWTATRPWRGFRQHQCGRILISGSSQPDPKAMEFLFLRKNIDIDVDLREEPHLSARDKKSQDPGNANGYLRLGYTNRYDRPNPGISLSSLHRLEKNMTANLNQSGKIAYSEFSPDENDPTVTARIDDATTEEEDIQRINRKRKALGFAEARYIRVPITDDMPPTAKAVDKLAKIIARAQKERKNIHFHCVAGQGRTTTAMVIADIMGGMSFKKALKYEIRAGGKDLRTLRANEILDPVELRGWALRLGTLRRFASYWHSTSGKSESFEAYMKKHPMDEAYMLKMIARLKILPAKRQVVRHGRSEVFDAA